MNHLSKRGLVALIVGLTVLASFLPFVFGSGGDEERTFSSVSSTSQVIVPYSPSNQGIMDPAAIFKQAMNSGVQSDYIYLPNMFAQGLGNSAVTPLYGASPAPMGLTDYGYMEPSGLKIPYQYNTSSFVATVMFESLKAEYLMNNNPDKVAAQLSAVLAMPNGQGAGFSYYWIKNIMLYTPSTGEAQFISNIWDLSTPSLNFPPGDITSGNGEFLPGLMYYCAGPTITLSDESTVALYVNSVLINGSTAILFQYSSGSTEHGEPAPGITYDTVAFSTPMQGGLNGGGKFIVDGFSKTPSGFLKDVELAITGPGMGSTTNIYNANGQLTLKFMGADGTYTKLPAAYNYGSNTGETVQGLSVWWSSQMKPMAHLTTGPSIPVSMWGSQVSHSGAVNLQGKIDPANAFVFISMGKKIDNGTAAWAPVNQNGTYMYSLPGRITYTMEVLMSNYAPQYITIATSTNESSDEGTGQSHGGGGGGEGEDETLAWNNFSLSANENLGVYTPLYINGDVQIKSLTSGNSTGGMGHGMGTVSDPYVMDNNQYTRIDGLFTRTNNFLYPQFSGILIENTDSSIKIDSPPSFQYKYPVGTYNLLASFDLPYYNNFNIILHNTSMVSITNATSITGWFPDTMVSGALASVMVLDSSDFFVSSNYFSSMGSSLSVYSGNGNPDNGTVWGNVFAKDAITGSSYATSMYHSSHALGVSVFSSGNILYNNFFAQGVSVSSPLYDPYTLQQTVYYNSWNLPEETDAAHAMDVNGHQLHGSIVGTAYQGGNYWENSNIATLAYNANGGIAYGGDYLPLVPGEFGVSFSASGDLPTAGWSVYVQSTSLRGFTPLTDPHNLMNGTYVYKVNTNSNYEAYPASGTFTVNGSGIKVDISFAHMTYPVTFVRSGISENTEWSLHIGNNDYSTTGEVMAVNLENGSYSYSASVNTNNQLAKATGSVLVSGDPLVYQVSFSNKLHEVHFEMNKEQFASTWHIVINGMEYTSDSGSIDSMLEDGVYQYTVAAPEGYTVTPSTGTLNVYEGNITVSLTANVETYKVTFVANGLTSGTPWGIQFGVQTVNTTSGEISFEVPTGTYSYNISGNSPYSVTEPSGQVVISHSNASVNVVFQKQVDYLGSLFKVVIGIAFFTALSAIVSYFMVKRR